jgi:predicted transcriptional regulator
MKAVTVKVTEACDARVSRLARERGTSKSEVIRDALERGLVGDDPLEDIRDLIGLARGAADLATNAAHLRGYGED